MVIVVAAAVVVVVVVVDVTIVGVVLKNIQRPSIFILKINGLTHLVSIDYSNVVTNLEDEWENPLRPIELRHVGPRSNDKIMKLIDHSFIIVVYLHIMITISST